MPWMSVGTKLTYDAGTAMARGSVLNRPWSSSCGPSRLSLTAEMRANTCWTVSPKGGTTLVARAIRKARCMPQRPSESAAAMTHCYRITVCTTQGFAACNFTNTDQATHFAAKNRNLRTQLGLRHDIQNHSHRMQRAKAARHVGPHIGCREQNLPGI